MKFKKIIVPFFLLLFLFLVSCGDTSNHDEKTKITFELEGGSYQNCTSSIIQYYSFKENTSNLIKEPTEFSKAKITKAGYNLEGWYAKKTQEADKVVYSEKWDFSNDKVGSEGITLYANWKKDIKYTYNVCYYDDDQKLVSLGIYEVNEGEKFSDYSNFVNRRIGYTKISFKDINGEAWDSEYTHPGGENDLEVYVVTEFIKGRFSVVSTKEELLKSLNDNIYLLNDIDLEGASISFADYNKTFVGNNHTISNFNISYNCARFDLIDDFDEVSRKSLCISLFGNTDGAQISDVSFENATLDVNTTLSTTYKIYVAPLSVSMKNTNISNVKFTGHFGYSSLPTDFDVDNNLIFVTDSSYYIKDEASQVTNIIINVTKD